MIYVITQIPGLGARSSAANFWPQLDNCGGGSQRDEGVGSVNSDLTEVNMISKNWRFLSNPNTRFCLDSVLRLGLPMKKTAMTNDELLGQK